MARSPRMAVKTNHIYTCQSCGTAHPKWSGKCEACSAWNTLVEETLASIPKGLQRNKKITPLDFVALSSDNTPLTRYLSHMNEFDRVCGGGLVPGSVILVGGDPGIGKSTILLQIIAKLSAQHECLYISGEEGYAQIRFRAERIGVDKTNIALATGANVSQILASIKACIPPQIIIIDSIQTMFVASIDSAPGTVTQVRAATQELIRVAKRYGSIIILVGHVTKEGALAGPRVLEHMVDTVLYFEGERGHHFRLLRSVKNRFGPTNEIGVFEMTARGLEEVANPSSLFLAEREDMVSGLAVFAGLEGTRPVLVEIEALASSSSWGTPRRAVVGWDNGRLSMIIAVLEARCGLNFSGKDIYLNVTGGLKISEPGADLAVASALISSLLDIPLSHHTIFFGEVGLSGEVRPVQQMMLRLAEAQKLGFNAAYAPKIRDIKTPLDIRMVEHLDKLVHSIKQLTPRNI